MGWVPAIAWLLLRRFRANWALLVITGLGVLFAQTLISASDLYSRALSESGARYLMNSTHPSVLNTRVIVQDRPLGYQDYQRLISNVEPAIESHLNWMLKSKERYGRSQHIDMVVPPDLIPRKGGFLGRGFFQTDFPQHVQITNGRWPKEKPIVNNGGVEVEGVIGSAAANRMKLSVGSYLYLIPFKEQTSERITITIVGTMEPIDIRDEYWMGYADYFDLEGVYEDRFSLPIYLSQEDYLHGLGARFPFLVGEYGWLLYTDNDAITAETLSNAIAALPALEKEINKIIPRSLVLSGLDNTLETFRKNLALFRIPVLVFFYLLLAVLFYFLFLIMGILTRSRRGEISLLRSRGASSIQINIFLLLSDGLLIAVAIGLGPLVALTLSEPVLYAMLGPRVTLDTSRVLGFSHNLAFLAAIGALITVGLMIVQNMTLIRLGIMEQLWERARPPSLPWIQRYYLDFAILTMIILVWWQIHERSGFVTRSILGGALEVEPTLLLGPFLAFVGVSLLIFRLLPGVVKALNRLAIMAGPIWISIALQRMAKDSLPYALLTVMLMLASGLSIFAATFHGTLSQGTKDQTLYSVGGDLVVLSDSLISVEDQLHDISGIGTISTVHRLAVDVLGKPDTPSAQLLSLDSSTLAEVSWFREDFAAMSLAELVHMLVPDDISETGILLPEEAVSIGLWARLDTPGPPLTVWVRLRDGQGKYHSLSLGTAPPDGWNLMETLLITSQGPIESPIRLVSLQTRMDSHFDARVGSISIDDINVTSTTVPNQRIVIDGFEVFHPWVPIPNKGVVADTSEQSRQAAKNGQGGLKFSWTEPMSREPRGVLIPPGSFPLPSLGSSAFFIGENIFLRTTDIKLPIKIIGVLDYFPSVDPSIEGFLLVEDKEYREYVRAIGNSRLQYTKEYWLNLSREADREVVVSDIKTQIGAGSLVLDSQDLLEQAQRDPLSGRSWKGLAILSVVTLAVSVAITCILQGTASIQARRVELVVLRTLGLSSGFLKLSLVVELGLSTFFGILTGTATGLVLAVWALERLDTTFEGLRTIPPLIVTIQPWLVVTIIAVLFGASTFAISVVSSIGNRLQAFHVLRVEQ